MADRNDVAKRAGVSGATVSRVFNNPASVSASTREKVMKAAEELGYHPNIIASNFVRGITGNIGVIVPHIPNVHVFAVYYFSEILSGIGETLSENGYDLILFFHPSGDSEENSYFQYFRGGKVDGCILLGTKRDDASLLKLREAGYKFCLVNNYIEESGISFVDVDNISGSYEAVKHLLRLGHRNIAFLNGPMFYSNSVDRLKGYKSALEEHSIPFQETYLLEGNYGRKSGYQAAQHFMELTDRPTAVFVSNDRMAAGLMQGLKDQGIKIPQDVAVVGYDDSDIATLVKPELTTVKVPFYELGRRCAAEFLKEIKEISGSAGHFNVFLKPELVIRKSSGDNSIRTEKEE